MLKCFFRIYCTVRFSSAVMPANVSNNFVFFKLQLFGFGIVWRFHMAFVWGKPPSENTRKAHTANRKCTIHMFCSAAFNARSFMAVGFAMLLARVHRWCKFLPHTWATRMVLQSSLTSRFIFHNLFDYRFEKLFRNDDDYDDLTVASKKDNIKYTSYTYQLHDEHDEFRYHCHGADATQVSRDKPKRVL